MKSFDSIQEAIRPGDYEILGKALRLSPETIRKILNGKRTDKDGKVQIAFNMLIEHRKDSDHIIVNRIQRKFKLQAA